MLEPSPAIAKAKQEIIDDLLKELPTNVDIEVELPSENKIYTLEDPGAPITIRPMTFEDEKQLISASKDQDPVNLILQRCTSNINIPDLLSMDKLYLIMKLREISYGDDYSTLLICHTCKTENPITVRLSQLNINPVPDNFTDPVELELPVLKKMVKVTYPRVRDEKLFLDAEKTLDQLWRFVVEVGGHTDKSVIAAVVNQLPIRDIRTILNAIKTDFGLDTNIKFECHQCKEVSVVDLPLDANFFNVN
tara:strand:+ start:411 stop:1157 length:747 start_codon:yes stop_codon:yes gene_type:complete